MTRKDYELIARAIARANKTLVDGEWLSSESDAKLAIGAVVYELTETLAATNPRFDSVRFNAACYAESLAG